MNKKKMYVSILFVAMTLIGIIGCGSDEETTDKTITDPTESFLTKEDLIGTWEVVTINGLTSQQFLESPIGDDHNELEIAIEKFNFIFADDYSWKLNLEFASVFDFPEILQDPGLFTPDGIVLITSLWSGTYSIENVMLSLINIEDDVTVLPDPLDFLLAFDGQTIPQAETDFIEGFKEDFLTPFALSNATPQRYILTLITTAGKKMELERQ